MLVDFTNGVVLVINMVCIFALAKKLRSLTSEWFDNPSEEIRKFQVAKKRKSFRQVLRKATDRAVRPPQRPDCFLGTTPEIVRNA